MDSEVDSFPESIANTVNLLRNRGYDVRIGYRDGEPAAINAVQDDVTISVQDWRQTWACSLRSDEIDYDEMYDRPSRIEDEICRWLDDLED